jgi:hypothetical protein
MFEGGCHCGEIRFRITTDKREVLDCDCSMCAKKAILHLIVEAREFTLLQGEDSLSEYQFGSHVARHLFCKRCGIHAFYVPRSHPEGYSVNFRCLDDFGTLKEEFEIRSFDGSAWERNIDSIR